MRRPAGEAKRYFGGLASLQQRVRTRALKAAGQLHQATALVVSETGMTEAEAGLFVGALEA